MANRSFEERLRLMQEPHEIQKIFNGVKRELEATQQNFHVKNILPALNRADECVQYWSTKMQDCKSQDYMEDTSRMQPFAKDIRKDLEHLRREKHRLIASFREERMPLEHQLLQCAQELLKRRRESLQRGDGKKKQQMSTELGQDMQALTFGSQETQAGTAEVPPEVPPHQQLGDLDQLEQRFTELVSEDKTLLPHQEELQESQDILGQPEDVEELLKEMEKEADSMKYLRLRMEERASRFCTFLASVEELL